MPEGNASCTLPDGTVVDLTSASPADAQACLSNPGTTLRLAAEDEQASPPPAPKKKAMDPKPEQTEAIAAPEAPVVAPAAEATPVLTAHEGQASVAPAPATASSEIAQLLQSSGGGALGLVAALIAVVGGTAGFKLWTKISEQRH